MKKITSVVWVTLSILLISLTHAQAKTPVKKPKAKVSFVVDVSNAPEDDLFKVTVIPKRLNRKNNVYNLASTAPGTYDILDFGRFVKSFKALDKSGNEIKTEKISTNRWKIADPGKVAKIEYTIEDSFDAKVKKYHVAPMCGTGIEKKYILMNTFGVMGYFEGMQSAPVRYKLIKPKGWEAGTALELRKDGYYYARNFDHLADSPMLVGELTKASTKINGIDVEIYVNSANGLISAQNILDISQDVLKAASKFITYAPVNRYAFLMVLIDRKMMRRNTFRGLGALEHSYSSAYVYPEMKRALPRLKSTMAHEFFHIVTPLNIHSEVIEKYNFATPTADEHLWLYEGVTEWASDIMQMRDGQLSMKKYLREMSSKISTDEIRYNAGFSLSRLSLQSYQPAGSKQYGNIYQRGALVAALLDIRLLELSNGKRGLRELIIDLSKKYGKQRAFNSKKFFDVLVKETYPEIRQFVNDHIRGTKPLPFAEYYGKVGVKYIKERLSANKKPYYGISRRPTNKGEVLIAGFGRAFKPAHMKSGDILLKVNGEAMSWKNRNQIFAKLEKMKVGDSYKVVVRRDGKEMTFKEKLVQRRDFNVLEPMKNLTPAQKKLQDVWKQNLPVK